MLNLLTGPVDVRPQARRAMVKPAAPHRSSGFLEEVAATRSLLCQLTGAAQSQLLLGSGTLANDVVAAQLSLRPGRGLVLSNGEFGDRLASHAMRFALRADVLRWDWGDPIDLGAVERHLETARPGWMWCTYLETSTGVLNDVSRLAECCRRHGTALCLDTISALGLVPLQLADVLYATGVSGKGLRGYPGLAMVFYNHDVFPSTALPRYLDLGLYATAAGVPFTHSSNLVGALRAALDGVDWRRHLSEIAQLSAGLRTALRAAGFHVIAAEAHAAPGVVTVALPASCPSTTVGAAMETAGVRLGAGSDYLRDRNWIQFSLMSRPSAGQLERAVRTLLSVCGAVAAPLGRRRRLASPGAPTVRRLAPRSAAR